MKDKEKQIEEMASHIRKKTTYGHPLELANELYKIAFPQNTEMLTEERVKEIAEEQFKMELEGKVVLTRERYEELTSRRYIVTPKKLNPVEEILKRLSLFKTI